MNKNEIQNYLDEKFPELHIMVRQDPEEPRGYIIIGFRTDIQIRFYLMSGFDDDTKYELLYHIEDTLYKKLGLLNKAINDIREIRRSFGQQGNQQP